MLGFPVDIIIKSISFSLTDTEIKDVSGSPSVNYDILPALSDNTYIFISGFIQFTSYAKYTNINATDAFLGFVSASAISNGFFNSPSLNRFSIVLGSDINTPPQITCFEFSPAILPADSQPGSAIISSPDIRINKPLSLQIYNGDGELTGGDSRNKLEGTIFYAIR